MKVLFLGGYGNISWWCVKQFLDLGNNEVYIINRAITKNSRRPMDKRAKVLNCDIRDFCAIKKLLDLHDFDIVCDFLCYNQNHAKTAIKLFKGKIRQYIVISTSAVYDRCKLIFPLTEDLPQYSEYAYVIGKIEMEKVFLQAYKKDGFPVTIVRPGQTYDTLIPDGIGRADFTIAQRMIDGKPIILCGDGTTLWTLTHSSDFANAFIQLIGNPKTIGEAYHITSDEVLNWREITLLTAKALKLKSIKVEFMPHSFIQMHHPEIGIPIAGHRLYCDIYDNTKIKKLLPDWKCQILFKDGIKKSINWLNEKESHRRINSELDSAIEDLLEKYKPCSNIVEMQI